MFLLTHDSLTLTIIPEQSESMEGSAKSSADTSLGFTGVSDSQDSSTVQFSQAQNRVVQEDKAEAMKVLRVLLYRVLI